MSCRRWALAPIVALAFTGLVGGPAASAAPSSTSEPTATSAAKKKSTSKKKKAKKPTVASLDKRLKKTEKDLIAARKQLRTVQRATAGLVGGLDSVLGASGSIEALLGGGLGGALGPEIAKIEALVGQALGQASSDNVAGLLGGAIGNPAVKAELEKLLTGLFGVSPTTIGQSVATLGPTIQTTLEQYIRAEQPVLIVRSTNGDQAKSILGPDVPDDANPVTVSASVPLKVTGAGDLQVLAGVRSLETDNGHDEVILDSLEVVEGSGDTISGVATSAVRVGSSAFTIPSGARLGRTSDPGSLPSLDIAGSQMTDPVGTAAGKISLTGTGYVMVRVTARFKDNIPTD
ncbi:MAG: hypothetical protein JHC84_04835 [Solirubrobacteraceae bacterium]|nr:hypothetical protein [Solirubrobacteraceae bacterium]